MKVQIHSIRFDADQKLIDYIQKKIDKLTKYYDRVIDSEIFLRLEKDDNMENKIFEIKMNIPGSQLFVKENSRSFEAATDVAVETLKRQLTKHKDKLIAH